MEQKLKEQVNQVELVGTLKSHNMEVRASKTDGSLYISGKARVEVIEEGNTNVITVSVFAKEGNKIFDGLQTVINEYVTTEQAVEKTGDQNAKGERIKVRGSLALEEYISTKTEKITSFNQVRGVFFNRIKPTDEAFSAPDYTKGLVELNIVSITPKADATGIPTGELTVKAFSVGYNERIIPFDDLVVGVDLAAAFQAYFRPNTTAKLSLRIVNYAVAKEEVAPAITTAAFGQSFDDINERVVYDYVNHIRIVGGDNPYTDFRALTPEQFETAARLRQTAIDSLGTPAAATTGFTQGFGGTQQQSPHTQTAVDNNLPFNNTAPFGTTGTPNF